MLRAVIYAIIAIYVILFVLVLYDISIGILRYSASEIVEASRAVGGDELATEVNSTIMGYAEAGEKAISYIWFTIPAAAIGVGTVYAVHTRRR